MKSGKIRASVISFLFAACGTSTVSSAAESKEVSADTVKKSCKAAAQRDGFSVGDFGDVKFDADKGVWITELNVQGKAEKLKARCEWDGSGTPGLFVWGTQQDIAPRKYNKVDVTKACKSQAQAQGLEVGDFGDTTLDKATGQWVSRLMVRREGEKKFKARCLWDGRRDPVIQ